jgi:hypothetical protein
MKHPRLAAVLLPLLAVLGLVAMPSAAQAASTCSGVSGYWTCYATTGSTAYHQVTLETVVLQNNTSKAITMNCGFTQSESYSSSSTQSATVSIKAGLWGVAEGTVSGTQSQTMTISSSSATTLGGSPSVPAHTTYTCRLFNGYYSVPTDYQTWSNYVVTHHYGTTTVPFKWGVSIT